MRNINFKALIWSAVVFAVAFLVVLFAINGAPIEIKFASIKYVAQAVTFDLILWFYFVKWGWRCRIFQGWLVLFPVLRGTWHGTIKSEWIDKETGKKTPPIQVVLVIKQTFLRVDCEVLSHTDESSSQSYVAEFYIDKDSGAKWLLYTYRNFPKVSVRGHSAIHDGTAFLKIITKHERRMQGEYWTNRGSVGEIDLSFYSNEFEESYPQSLVGV